MATKTDKTEKKDKRLVIQLASVPLNGHPQLALHAIAFDSAHTAPFVLGHTRVLVNVDPVAKKVTAALLMAHPYSVKAFEVTTQIIAGADATQQLGVITHTPAGNPVVIEIDEASVLSHLDPAAYHAQSAASAKAAEKAAKVVPATPEETEGEEDAVEAKPAKGKKETKPAKPTKAKPAKEEEEEEDEEDEDADDEESDEEDGDEEDGDEESDDDEESDEEGEEDEDADDEESDDEDGEDEEDEESDEEEEAQSAEETLKAASHADLLVYAKQNKVKVKEGMSDAAIRKAILAALEASSEEDEEEEEPAKPAKKKKK